MKYFGDQDDPCRDRREGWRSWPIPPRPTNCSDAGIRTPTVSAARRERSWFRSRAASDRSATQPTTTSRSARSSCYLEGRAIQEADALQQRRRILTWAAAAVVALAAGTGAWILTARISSVDTEIQAQLDLRPHAIMRGETQTTERPPMQLPRGRVLLTLLLPTGSEPCPSTDVGTAARSVARTVSCAKIKDCTRCTVQDRPWDVLQPTVRRDVRTPHSSRPPL